MGYKQVNLIADVTNTNIYFLKQKFKLSKAKTRNTEKVHKAFIQAW